MLQERGLELRHHEDIATELRRSKDDDEFLFVCLKFLEIARECCGITRDVRNARRPRVQYAFDNCRFSTCSRRIEKNKIDRVRSVLIRTDPIRDCRRDDLRVRELSLLKVASSESCRDRVRLNSNHTLESAGQRQSKQTNTAIEIDCGVARNIE